MVGLVENALIEIKEKYRPDRIIIESRWVLLESHSYFCRPTFVIKRKCDRLYPFLPSDFHHASHLLLTPLLVHSPSPVLLSSSPTLPPCYTTLFLSPLPNFTRHPSPPLLSSTLADLRHSGSAFPATLALQIRQLEPQGFKLDGVVTVIDCVNFRGYEDRSPSAKVGSSFDDSFSLLPLLRPSRASHNLGMRSGRNFAWRNGVGRRARGTASATLAFEDVADNSVFAIRAPPFGVVFVALCLLSSPFELLRLIASRFPSSFLSFRVTLLNLVFTPRLRFSDSTCSLLP